MQRERNRITHRASITALAAALLLSLMIGSGAAAQVTGGAVVSIQTLVDRASPGATVAVPAGVYRETVTIDKPITLNAAPGAEIRGSDVWTGWTRSGGYWKKGTLGTFQGHGECEVGTKRCLWPEQVFFDGKPLVQVASSPGKGQFAVDANRKIVLANDPSGHTVEVTTRRKWIVGESDNVVIQGFTMKHAANDAQTGALDAGGGSGWTVRDNVLSYAHGDIVDMGTGTLILLQDNNIHHGGHLGVKGSGGGYTLRGNEIHHNNTERFKQGWSAGGMKNTQTQSLVVEGNKVYLNNGPGLWCDANCSNVTYVKNRIHHNARAGIQFEISDGAKISGNVIYNNGKASSEWAWGGGIVSSSSTNLEIWNNVVAWNADGISIVSANRPGHTSVRNIFVHDNTILQTDRAPDSSGNYGLGWFQPWSTKMFAPESNNRGVDNRYWFTTSESSRVRYAWNDTQTQLRRFNPTRGEEGWYMGRAQKDNVVSTYNIPATP